MQTMPPVFVAALPLAERPQANLAIQGLSQAGSSGANGETDNPDARDPALARDQAREVARLLGGRSAEEEYLIPGFPPLDTREVGDQDIIDPNRPAVRGPDPLEDVEIPEALPPLPDEVDPTKTEAQVETEAALELPGAQKPEQEGEAAETKAEETQSPNMAAQPASPGASAPDVPEPPAPGNVDIRR